jgi:hypothetical protein
LIAKLEGATWTSAEQVVLNSGKRIASSIEIIADNDEGTVVRAREVRDFRVHDISNQPSGQNGVRARNAQQGRGVHRAPEKARVETSVEERI